MQDLEFMLENGTQIAVKIEWAGDRFGRLHLQVTLECKSGEALIAEQIAVTRLTTAVEQFVKEGAIRPRSKYEYGSIAE